MRQFFVLLILGVGAYFGWDYYQNNRETIVFPWQKTAAGDPAIEQGAATAEGTRTGGPTPPPEARFVSKIRLPAAAEGRKAAAPAGYVYVTERASMQTPNGVVAVVPGDLVKLLQRKADGSVRVTNDLADFEMKADAVTLDPEVALAAEKREFDSRAGRP